MISAGYKSAYQQGYSDAMCDFRKKSKTDVLDNIRAEIDNVLSDGMIHKQTVLVIIDKYKAGEDKE